MLVDAGVGRIHNDHYAGGGFLDALAAHGVSPADVTDVVFTHLHFDHVGWATSKGEVVFGNATYRVHAADWAHFVDAADAEPGAVRKLAPLRDRLEVFDTETTLAPGLDARPTPGHTPGSTTYVVSGGGERALLVGDVAHSVVELEEPDWEATFDVDPRAAQAMRNALVREVTDTTDLVVPAHLPGLAHGRIVTVRRPPPLRHRLRSTTMDLQLAGTTVLVTGAGQGLGRAIGEAFAAEGAQVAFGYNTSAEGAEAAAEAVRATGVKAIAVAVDTRDDAGVARALDARRVRARADRRAREQRRGHQPRPLPRAIGVRLGGRRST